MFKRDLSVYIIIHIPLSVHRTLMVDVIGCIKGGFTYNPKDGRKQIRFSRAEEKD